MLRFRLPGRLGFTLIELLVVVAIVGLLIAILLPALRAAREAGRRSVCQAHLHNVGQAVVMYHHAYRGWFPLSSHTAGSIYRPDAWTANCCTTASRPSMCCPTCSVRRPALRAGGAATV